MRAATDDRGRPGLGARLVAHRAGVGCRWRDSKSRDGKLGRAGGTARITVSSDSVGQFLLVDERPLFDVPSLEEREDARGRFGLELIVVVVVRIVRAETEVVHGLLPE